MPRRLFAAVLPLMLASSMLHAAAPAGGKAPAIPKAQPDDWYTVNKDYSSRRYVELTQIKPENAPALKEVCEVDLNEPSWYSSGILKIDRTLYFTTRRMTYAVDGATCKPVWRNVATEYPYPVNYNNRGLAYLDGKLYRGTTNNRLLSIDMTGKTLWGRNEAGGTKGPGPISVVAAPIAWMPPGGQGMVFVGNATADLDVPGQMAAYSADHDMPLLWSMHTPLDPGLTGGAFWTSESLDPDTGELFVSASNPYPDYSRATRPGRNEQTDSVLSINARNGQVNWAHQVIASDVHDWDMAVAPTLYSTRDHPKMLAVAGKDGVVYGIDRSQPQNRLFAMSAIPREQVGMPFPEAGSKVSPTAAVRVCPGTIGGTQFTGPAYSPQENALYVGMNDWCWFYYGVGTDGYTRPDYALRTPPRGTITALDAETGQIRWQHKIESQVQAGVVATSGGVVFAADTFGHLYVMNAHTGAIVNTLDIGGAVNSGLITYQVDGVQYVAAEVGGLSLNAPGMAQPQVPGIPAPQRPGGPLRLKIFALNAGAPTHQSFDRVPVPAMILPPPVPVPPTEKAKVGETLYNTVCSACHNVMGGGGPYPPLATQQYALSDAARLKHVFETVAPPMPRLYEAGRPSVLSDTDVDDLVAYFQSLPFPPQTGYVQPTSIGSEDWKKIYSVLTYPRCINCHTTADQANGGLSYPRQSDDRHPHHYGVLRGADDKGTAIARCETCHKGANDDGLGIPGATDWHLAPSTMAWETAPNVAMDGSQLCTMLKNPNLNGQRDLGGLLLHIKGYDQHGTYIPHNLIEWAFAPGKQLNGQPRTTPPLTYTDFVDVFASWVNAGGPCPPASQAAKPSATKSR
jgi:alcohol dehydrogenase (cytochrome c)